MVSDSGGGRTIEGVEGGRRGAISRARRWLSASPADPCADFPDIFPVNFPLRARSSLDAFSISLALPPLTRPDAPSAVRLDPRDPGFPSDARETSMTRLRPRPKEFIRSSFSFSVLLSPLRRFPSDETSDAGLTIVKSVCARSRISKLVLIACFFFF